MIRFHAFLVTLFIVCGCVAPPPLAPTTDPVRFSGTIFQMDNGRVGGVVASARLTIVSGPNTNATVSTDGEGHYDFPMLVADTFDLTISAPGFVTLNPKVNLGRDLEVNFVLSPE